MWRAGSAGRGAERVCGAEGGPGVEERRFVRPRPTAEDEHADEVAAQKALLEGELGELRGQCPPSAVRSCAASN